MIWQEARKIGGSRASRPEYYLPMQGCLGCWLSLVLLVGCGEHSKPPAAHPPRAHEGAQPARQAVDEPFRVGEYVLSEAARANSRALLPDAPDGRGGVLVDGVRMGADGSIGKELAEPSLRGGARLPAHVGGGFLFWSVNTLYRSRTVTGDLAPLLELTPGRGIHRVGFGPDFVLLHFLDGSRLALDVETRSRATVPVPGLIDVAALGDGRSVLLAEPNRVLVRRDPGEPYEDRTAVVPLVTGLRASLDSIQVLSRSEGVFNLEPDGTFSRTDRPPSEPEPILRGVPDSLVVRAGVPLPDGRALVPVHGAFRKVELRTGATVSESKPVLASADTCSLLPTGSDVLALCWTSTRDTVVVAGAASSTPRIERTFADQVTFFAGDSGTLAKDGPCAGPDQPTRVTVCVRDRTGSWREFSVPAAAESAETPDAHGARLKPRIARWVPTADGSALGIVSGKRSGLLHAKERRFARFVHPKSFREDIFRVDGRPLLDDRFTVLADGTIVGYAAEGVHEGRALVANASLRQDGTVKTGPIGFDVVGHAGPLALAEEGGRLWQSVDFGQQWRPVASPPGFAHAARKRRFVCARAGCDLGEWYRIGFPETPPHAEESQLARRGSWPVLPPAPRLVCRSLEAPKSRTVTPAYSDEGTPIEIAGFGARVLRMREDAEPNLSEFMTTIGGLEVIEASNTTPPELIAPGDPGYRAALRAPSEVLFHQLFGPPSLLQASITWNDVFRVTAAAHLAFEPEITSGGSAVPILSPRTGESAGLLLAQSGWVAWLGDRRPTRLFALGLLNDYANPVGAYAAGDDTLWLLVEDDAKVARILQLTAAGARIFAELPPRPSVLSSGANADFLAVGRTGEPVVLRIPSFDPPTADDPALLLAPGKPPVPLAPWSALGAGSTCTTDASAVRAIVELKPGWLGVNLPGSPDEPATALGMVRWSQERVCLEALEFPLDTRPLADGELQLLVSARLEGEPRAYRYGFWYGAEYVERVACRLEVGR